MYPPSQPLRNQLFQISPDCINGNLQRTGEVSGDNFAIMAQVLEDALPALKGKQFQVGNCIIMHDLAWYYCFMRV